MKSFVSGVTAILLTTTSLYAASPIQSIDCTKIKNIRKEIPSNPSGSAFGIPLHDWQREYFDELEVRMRECIPDKSEFYDAMDGLIVFREKTAGMAYRARNDKETRGNELGRLGSLAEAAISTTDPNERIEKIDYFFATQLSHSNLSEADLSELKKSVSLAKEQAAAEIVEATRAASAARAAEAVKQEQQARQIEETRVEAAKKDLERSKAAQESETARTERLKADLAALNAELEKERAVRNENLRLQAEQEKAKAALRELRGEVTLPAPQENQHKTPAPANSKPQASHALSNEEKGKLTVAVIMYRASEVCVDRGDATFTPADVARIGDMIRQGLDSLDVSKEDRDTLWLIAGEGLKQSGLHGLPRAQLANQCGQARQTLFLSMPELFSGAAAGKSPF